MRWWVGLAAVLVITACSGTGPVDGPGNPLAPGRPGSLRQVHPHAVATAVSADAATVDLVSGATTVTIRAADLGGLGPDTIPLLPEDPAPGGDGD